MSPARSRKQQQMMAIALHNPSKLRGKNRKVLKMGKKALRDFAETKTKHLPALKKHMKRR